MKRLVFAAALTCVAAQAQAYDSRCYIAGAACAEGPQATRGRWLGESDEHRELFERGMDFAGLPAGTKAPLVLKVFTSAEKLQISGNAEITLIPAAFASVARSQDRTWTVAEFAQLPDFSYSLFDWALGNETCPSDNTDAVTCHTFAGHMGGLNSNHFLPQAQGFYRHYHELAVARSTECKGMSDALGSDAARFIPFLLDCEKQALLLEAIAQHYLQDAWSSGHMWARWGSPDLADFPSLLRATTVAVTSGIVHGARAVIQPELLPGIVLDADDALCAPHPEVEWKTAEGMRHRGLGDLYMSELLDDAAYEPQHDALFACSVAGIRAVYQASGQHHGDLGPPSGPGRMTVDPISEACFGQRVTNQAMKKGFGIDVTLATGPLNVPISPQVAGGLVLAGESTAMAKPPTEAELAVVKAQYAFDMIVLSAKLEWNALFAPNATTMASGGLGPLLDVQPNGSYLADPPAPYADPELPWILASPSVVTRPQNALLRTFHPAYGDDWCQAFSGGPLQLEELRTRVGELEQVIASLPPGDPARIEREEDKLHACSACVEFAQRHLRLGTGAATYDTAREPLCFVLSPQATVVYANGPTLASASNTWCSCP